MMGTNGLASEAQGSRDGGNGAGDLAGVDGDGHGHRGGPAHGQQVMPASIVRAISAIKATVAAVKKSQRNSHGGYMFSSTDDVYAAISRKMGEVGYHVHALEEKCEVVRIEKTDKDGRQQTSQWLHAVYSFLHATEADTWSHPKDRRTIYVQITGPQTFQGAQSFAEKSYFRSLFKLPSGDMDLDSMPQAETEEDQLALSQPAIRKRKSSAAAKRDGDNDALNEIRGAISSADGPADLAKIKIDNAAFWQNAPARWAEILDHEYEDKMRELQELDFSNETMAR